MSRPKEHGGGQAGPPIAGDPSTFPADSELARTLVARETRGSLSTVTDDLYPYGSVVSYAVDNVGNPILLISEMAEHTVNARSNPKSSLLLTANSGSENDPLSTARLTLLGQMELVENPGDLRDRYLAVHPYASYYADFTDFGFWRLRVEKCRFIGGFGHMSWVTLNNYKTSSADPLGSDAPDIVEHMNTDHQEANLLYAQQLASLETATSASMVSVDTYGFTLKVETPDAPRMARLGFAKPVATSGEARHALIDLLQTARSAAQ